MARRAVSSIGAETFPADGAAWSVAGGVDTADVTGRPRPAASDTTGYSLGRMKAAVPTRDVEVTFTLVFEQQSTQGVGLYVRQNGGRLQQTDPDGEGYAIWPRRSRRARRYNTLVRTILRSPSAST